MDIKKFIENKIWIALLSDSWLGARESRLVTGDWGLGARESRIVTGDWW